MCERSLRMNIPASSRVGSIRVDDDKAMLVSKLPVWCARKVGLGGAGAVVGCDENWGVGGGCDLIRDIDVHANVGGVRAKIGDLLERSTEDGADSCEEPGERGSKFDHGVVDGDL